MPGITEASLRQLRSDLASVRAELYDLRRRSGRRYAPDVAAVDPPAFLEVANSFELGPLANASLIPFEVEWKNAAGTDEFYVERNEEGAFIVNPYVPSRVRINKPGIYYVHFDAWLQMDGFDPVPFGRSVGVELVLGYAGNSCGPIISGFSNFNYAVWFPTIEQNEWWPPWHTTFGTAGLVEVPNVSPEDPPQIYLRGFNYGSAANNDTADVRLSIFRVGPWRQVLGSSQLMGGSAPSPAPGGGGPPVAP